ncbi:MAG: phosphopantetheine-binding protein [Actinomycetota bacterium]|nr:phosphopantetheine-binding protein [Actinomycetota bacterium]
MTRDQAHRLIRSTLRQVAPEVDLDQVSPDETLQEALDLDSIDFLNFVAGLSKATGRDIPERDYPQMSTVEGCIAYLTALSPAD